LDVVVVILKQGPVWEGPAMDPLVDQWLLSDGCDNDLMWGRLPEEKVRNGHADNPTIRELYSYRADNSS
jgi:hypothetical protein